MRLPARGRGRHGGSEEPGGRQFARGAAGLRRRPVGLLVLLRHSPLQGGERPGSRRNRPREQRQVEKEGQKESGRQRANDAPARTLDGTILVDH